MINCWEEAHTFVKTISVLNRMVKQEHGVKILNLLVEEKVGVASVLKMNKNKL